MMYYLSKLPGVFYLISAKNQDKTIKLIMQCALSKNSLFSITRETDGTTSILFRPQDQIEFEEILNSKSSDVLISPDRYYCFRLDTENPAINEAGMLANVTTFLANSHIPILCLSTYNCNYVYYPINNSDEMIEAIRSAPESFTLDMGDDSTSD